MNMVAEVRSLGGLLLVLLLIGSTGASAQNCYQHRSGNHILRECSGDTATNCVTAQGKSYKIEASRKANWKKIADDAPGCSLDPEDRLHMKDAPPLRGKEEQDMQFTEDDW